MRLNLVQQLWSNPVVVKEVRTRMRGARAFTVVTVHLLIVGLFLALSYLIFSSSFNTSSNLEERGVFGKILFGLVVGLELVAISFTAPALTSGAIASEHERQTYDLIKVTLLRPSALVIVKYLSGLSFILLLLFSALPLLGPAFIIGGVLPQEIIIAILVLMVTAIAFCAVGLFFSSLVSRTLFATVLSYAFAIINVFGLPMIFLFLIGLFGVTIDSNPGRISLASQAVLIFLGWLMVSLNPGAVLVASEAALLNGQGVWLVRIPLQDLYEVTLIAPWIMYLWFNLLLSAVLLMITIYRVQRVEK